MAGSAGGTHGPHRAWLRRLRRTAPGLGSPWMLLFLGVVYTWPWLTLVAWLEGGPVWGPVAEWLRWLWFGFLALVWLLATAVTVTSRRMGAGHSVVSPGAPLGILPLLQLTGLAALVGGGWIDWAVAVLLVRPRPRAEGALRAAALFAASTLSAGAVLLHRPAWALALVGLRWLIGLALPASTLGPLRRLPTRQERVAQLGRHNAAYVAKVSGDEATAHWTRSRLLSHLGQEELWPEAAELLEALRELGVPRKHLMPEQPEICVETGRPEEAIHAGVWLTRKKGDLGSAAPAVALAHFRTGHAQIAVRLLRQAVRTKARGAWLARGRLHAERGAHDLALRCYEVALQQPYAGGPPARLLAACARSLEALGDHAEAVRAWRASARYWRWRNPEYLRDFARCLRATGRDREAEELDALTRET